jgi:hypothetical protein
MKARRRNRKRWRYHTDEMDEHRLLKIAWT